MHRQRLDFASCVCRPSDIVSERTAGLIIVFSLGIVTLPTLRRTKALTTTLVATGVSRGLARDSTVEAIDMNIVHFHDLIRVEADVTTQRSTDGNVEDKVETLVKWPLGTAGRVWRESEELIPIDIPRDLGLFPIYGIHVPLADVSVVVLALVRPYSMIVRSCMDGAKDLVRITANCLHDVQLTTVWPFSIGFVAWHHPDS